MDSTVFCEWTLFFYAEERNFLFTTVGTDDIL